MYVYLNFLLIFFGLPVLLIGWLRRKELFKYKRTLFWCFLFVYTIGWFWDWLSYKTGVWWYNSAKTLGIWLNGLSVEEFVGFYILGTLLIVSIILTILKHA
ncbi:MAG: lycopene cyclase domain-containing protein [bacterium]